jgi:hypothetical protein
MHFFHIFKASSVMSPPETGLFCYLGQEEPKNAQKWQTDSCFDIFVADRIQIQAWEHGVMILLVYLEDTAFKQVIRKI